MQDKTTKDRIVDAMYALVAEKGYDKASIGQIAQAIGIQKASVYYYFKSKEDIFLGMVKKLYQEDVSAEAFFKEDITAAQYQSALIAAGEAFIDSYFEHQTLRKVYAEIDIQTSRIPALKEYVNLSGEKFRQRLAQTMVRGVAVGAFEKECDTTLNSQLLYMVLTGIDQAILYDLPIDVKAVWRAAVSQLPYRKAILSS
ncbi:MAG: TetR/AcrR family transcriptional regulator [Ruthenibacterium sp.]